MGTVQIAFLFISEPLQPSFLSTMAENDALELGNKRDTLGDSEIREARQRRKRELVRTKRKPKDKTQGSRH